MEEEIKEVKPFDKFGECPCCKASWDGGDILEEIAKIEALNGKSQEDIHKLATSYGYTEENKNRFTKLVMCLPINHDAPTKPTAYYKCPMCGAKFDKDGKIIKIEDNVNNLFGE